MSLLLVLSVIVSCDNENIDDYLLPTCAKNPGNQTPPWEDGGNKEETIKKDTTASTGFDIKVDPWHGGRTDTLVVK